MTGATSGCAPTSEFRASATSGAGAVESFGAAGALAIALTTRTTQALLGVLPLCHGLGIDPALVTCDVDNEPSRRTIERAGGVYEDTREGKLRYWVPTHPR